MAKREGFPPKGAEAIAHRPPVPDTSRWVAKRKAEVVAAIESGALSMSEACERYQLTPEELTAWQQAVSRNGTAGLGAKSIQRERLKREDRRS
nr:DUF1153 domain-containing protein [Novosphingobium sp. 9U]